MRYRGVKALYSGKQRGRQVVTSKNLFSKLLMLLSEGGIESARFEAQCIMEYAAGLSRMDILKDVLVEEEQAKLLTALAERRVKGEPLQYLLGEWEFYGYPFKVGEGVLIPRQDTETLAEAAIESLNPEKTAIDLCCGSGCVAITLQKETGALVFGVEKYDKALEFLKENIALNKSSVKAVKGDVLSESALGTLPEADVITANPPYLTAQDMSSLQKEVSFEPSTALFGGEDGLDFYREITRLWKKKLKPEGLLFFEIGAGQDEDVKKILEENGFMRIRKIQDLTGTVRVVSGELPSGGI